jgi:hypothetical protein
MVRPVIGINPTGKRAMSKKRSGKTRARKPKSSPTAEGRSASVFSMAVGNLVNMSVTAVTSGSVLLCLFAAKRLL